MSKLKKNAESTSAGIVIQIACNNKVEMPTEDDICLWAKAVIALQPQQSEVTIRIIDEEEIQHLNASYRQKDYATNVLSFPFENPPGLELPILGDIAICATVVAREAEAQGKSLQAHWAHMIIHGCLHCQGYDHTTAASANIMEPLEIKLLAQFGFPNPYGALTSNE